MLTKNATRAAALRARPRTLAATIMATPLRPAGYWKLDETAGTTAVDSSGNGHTGTYTGSGYTLANKVAADGKSYVEFNVGGNPGYVVLTDDDVYTVGTNTGMTMFALVKPDSVSGTTLQAILGKSSGAHWEYGWFANHSVGGRLSMFQWRDDGNTIRAAAFDSILTTAWQAVAVIIAPPTSTSRIDQFRNGVWLNSTMSSVVGTAQSNTIAPLWIGWSSDSTAGRQWDGGMAHVAIWPGQLTAADLAPIFLAARQVTG